jgi:hypothetical protein
MQVIATRDGVHPGDDPLPAYRFEVPDETAPEDILRKAADRHWLPSFWDWQRNASVDRATWVITSNEILAVLAYQWPDLHFMPFLEVLMRTADVRDAVLWLHFNHLAWTEPDVAEQVVRALKLRSLSTSSSNMDFWEGKGPGYALLQKKMTQSQCTKSVARSRTPLTTLISRIGRKYWNKSSGSRR